MRSKMAAHMCPDVKTDLGRRWRRRQKRRGVTAGRPWALHVTPPGPLSRFHVFHYVMLLTETTPRAGPSWAGAGGPKNKPKARATFKSLRTSTCYYPI